jgi:N-acetylmuramic acid 6-phosphate etherase
MMRISEPARIRATEFLEKETQFHLGFLPTEQSNPKTRNLDKVFAADPAAGVDLLFAVDEDVVAMAGKVFASAEFAKMLAAAEATMRRGGKLIFSGCGATGRLSIVLESMWRTFFRRLEAEKPGVFAKVACFEQQVASIMTGGDYALVKSVESFEDYPQFGRRQAQELHIGPADMLVAITEGGETSSVLGTVDAAVEVGAAAFLLFNNPADILRRHLERSRRAIENPAVTVLDLHCGPMALAGSTRMQATTSEQLVAGAMLEKLLAKLLRGALTAAELAELPDSEIDYAGAMRRLVAGLRQPAARRAIAEYIGFEAELYRKGGLVTYFADEFILDIFTDTTERSPTFMTPPFRKCDDRKSPPSWAFVKTERFSTPDAWRHYLGREPRCLDWTVADYVAMKSPEKIVAAPPAISKAELYKFPIGCEVDPSRFGAAENAAVDILAGGEYRPGRPTDPAPFKARRTLVIGDAATPVESGVMQIPGRVEPTLLKLMSRLQTKLVMNTVSTGTMVLLGRVAGNWMSFVSMSNKKLIDRCIRLIAELGGVEYQEACLALHQSMIEIENTDFTGREAPSPVQYTLAKLGKAAAGK